MKIKNILRNISERIYTVNLAMIIILVFISVLSLMINDDLLRGSLVLAWKISICISAIYSLSSYFKIGKNV